jgi:lysophospholipase
MFSNGTMPTAVVRRRTSDFLLLLVLVTGIPEPAAPQSAPSSALIDPAVVQRLSTDMPPLDLARENPPLPADMQSFYTAYGLYHPRVRNYFGRFEAGGLQIAAYVFVPAEARGTVYCLHGYFDHVGMLQHLVRACLARGYAVAAFDLPGHGLSSGGPEAVADFGDYVAVLAEFVRRSRPQLPRPCHLVAHSTGGAVALEFIFTRPLQAEGFDTFVLAAPLIRHAYYRLSRLPVFLLTPFLQSFPRRFHANSHDPQFVERSKHDPLQGRRVPLSWLNALYRWNDRLADYAPSACPVMVIQGTEDDVLDWRSNVSLLREKLAAGRFELIEGARHQLFNEAAAFRRPALESVFSFFEAQPTTPGKGKLN